MLAGLRSAAKSKIAIPIIVVLAASFAVWGVSDAFRGRVGDAVATIGPEKISLDAFSERFRQQVQRYSQETGQGLTTQEARQLGMDQQVVSEMATLAALDAKARALDLGASDNALYRDISTTEVFQDSVRGEFSEDVYLTLLSQNGMRPRDYEEQLRGDIARQQLLSSLRGSVRPPEMLIEAREVYRNETRTAEVLVLPAGLVDMEEDPTDADLQAAIDDNPEYFQFPEQRAISVLWFDMESMLASLDVSDEDVRALYDFQADSLATPPTRSFIQISAPAEDGAEEAAGRLRAGEVPAAIAADLGLPQPIIEDGALHDDIVDGAIADQIFDGGMDPRIFVAEGDLGWAAIQVTGGAEGHQPTFEEVEEQLRLELAEDSTTDALYDAIANYEDARGEGRGLEESAKAVNLALHAYPPLTAGGQDADGARYQDLGNAPAILAEAFMLNPGQVSDLIETPDGGYAVLQVDEIRPERIAELDEVRPTAIALWRARREGEALEEIQQDARARLEAGASMADVAAEIGQPARNEIAVLRRGQSTGAVSASLNGQLFQADLGDLVAGTSSNGMALARVTSIDIEEGNDANVSVDMTAELQNDLLTQFQASLSEEYPVRIYPDQIDVALGEAVQ